MVASVAVMKGSNPPAVPPPAFPPVVPPVLFSADRSTAPGPKSGIYFSSLSKCLFSESIF